MLRLSLLLPFAAAEYTCPATFSNGPCFTSAKSWTEAQRTCETHGSNLVTVLNASQNAALGAGGCFSDAPLNDWSCTWVGATDMRLEGSFEWASGAALNYSNWGAYEPSTTVGDGQNCAAVCQGGSTDGYSGDFWVDLECDSEYAFCCDQDTFVYDAGTPAEDSFLASLSLVPPAAPPPPSSDARDFPVSERHLCFSTLLGWHDAQTMCESVGSNLVTIGSAAQLAHMGLTTHFSRVPDTWGLDWRCAWAGYHDQATEGAYEWVSSARPSYTPGFGPFEAGNGDGAAEDCVALCQSDCANASSAGCVDLAAYGYVGDFLIDTVCTDEYAFCCDGYAATFLDAARTDPTSPPPPPSPAPLSPPVVTVHMHDPSLCGGDDGGKDGTIAALAVVAALAIVAAVAATGVALSMKNAGAKTPTLSASPITTTATVVDTSGVAMYEPPRLEGGAAKP